jgi:hypothetical protein
MRIRLGLCLLAGCCAAITGCTAAPPKGPDTTVSTPSVGRPPPPASAQAAVSSEAFTPYAALGISSNDGLAPSESQYNLVGQCMNAAGYPGVTANDRIVRGSFGGGGMSLAFAPPFGGWGYLGTADAQQYGFQFTPGPGLTAVGQAGVTPGGTPPASPPSVPAAEQTAASKCSTILGDFTYATQKGALAGINTLTNDISNDVADDAAVKNATRAWSACMARNGYSFDQPMQLWNGSGPVTGPPNGAQIATAVTDADCTQSSDLAGIYFAVQASYEKQLVTANQQALDSAASAYRAAYAKELAKLPALLRTAKAQPFFPRAPGPSRPRTATATRDSTAPGRSSQRSARIPTASGPSHRAA